MDWRNQLCLISCPDKSLCSDLHQEKQLQQVRLETLAQLSGLERYCTKCEVLRSIIHTFFAHLSPYVQNKGLLKCTFPLSLRNQLRQIMSFTSVFQILPRSRKRSFNKKSNKNTTFSTLCGVDDLALGTSKCLGIIILDR